ncbi:MAG: tetratricopeptide repeat protein [Verrucomicrobiota bacterium]|nr:tetratricopeptide repeat protein [Verrucomicrobiota bacterium]
MSRRLMGLIGILLVGLCIQTVRLHRLQTDHAQVFDWVRTYDPNLFALMRAETGLQPASLAPNNASAQPASGAPNQPAATLSDSSAEARPSGNIAETATALRSAPRPTGQPQTGEAPARSNRNSASRATRAGNRADQSQFRFTNGDRARLEPLFAQAKKAYAEGDFERAWELLDEGLRLDPGNDRTYLTMAEFYRDRGMVDQELALFRDWAAAQPDSTTATFNLASALQRQGLESEALNALVAWENNRGESRSDWRQAAQLYRQFGLADDEESALSSWVKTAPGDPEAYSSLAAFYSREGSFQKSAQTMERLIEIEPGNVKALTRLATLHTQMGRFQDAQAEYLAAIELAPNVPGLHMQLGETYRKSGEIPLAIQAYQAVIDNNPGSSDAQKARRAINRLNQTTPK